MMLRDLPVWRSMLYVPITVERFVAKAAQRGADAIILDLEDSIPAQDKERARSLVEQAAGQVGRGSADVLVRVNRPWRLLVRDLEAAIGPQVFGLMLPKIESAEQVQMIAEVVGELEAERGVPAGHTRLVAMLETPGSIFRAEAIARADPRLAGITVGAEDLALAADMQPDADALVFPNQHAILAARSAGILPLGFLGTVADFADLDAFRATVRRSRRFGFAGASVIHPSQIAILNEEFRPDPAEVERAERMIAAYDKAVAEGRGAATFEGRMIDVPVVQRAQSLLARHRAIEARTRRNRAPE